MWWTYCLVQTRAMLLQYTNTQPNRTGDDTEMMTAGSSEGIAGLLCTYIKYKHNKIYLYIYKPSHVWPTDRPAAAGNRQTNGRPLWQDVTSGGSYACCVSTCVWVFVCVCVCVSMVWGWGSRWTIRRGFRISGNQVSRRLQYNI